MTSTELYDQCMVVPVEGVSVNNTELNVKLEE